jgi:hypothetical protein
MQYPMIAQPQYGFAPTMPMMANGGSVADAQSVQSKGRGRDTMLVHMTPKEVGGLQALAMQHGGSLTINPQTGLPEAGFLENMLPTLLGVGLSFIPGVGPLAAAGITTAIQTARTGDLGQGLIAGLGAYGGASLGAGLTSAGAAGAGASAAPTAGLEFATNPTDHCCCHRYRSCRRWYCWCSWRPFFAWNELLIQLRLATPEQLYTAERLPRLWKLQTLL